MIGAPSTHLAGWFLCSLRGDRTTRPSHLHHDCQLWSLTLITRCLWSPAVCRRPACSGAWDDAGNHKGSGRPDAQTAWLSAV